jgi:hypothetical protein
MDLTSADAIFGIYRANVLFLGASQLSRQSPTVVLEWTRISTMSIT